MELTRYCASALEKMYRWNEYVIFVEAYDPCDDHRIAINVFQKLSYAQLYVAYQHEQKTRLKDFTYEFVQISNLDLYQRSASCGG